jgi:hypothetical protein
MLHAPNGGASSPWLPLAVFLGVAVGATSSIAELMAMGSCGRCDARHHPLDEPSSESPWFTSLLTQRDDRIDA